MITQKTLRILATFPTESDMFSWLYVYCSMTIKHLEVTDVWLIRKDS